MAETHHERRMKELRSSGFHKAVIDFYTQRVNEQGSELSVLDLGAGSGLVSLSLASLESVHSIVAFDKDLLSMRKLQESDKIKKSVDGSHADLQFDGGQFDVVVCRYAFHHFDRKEQCLREIHRVLKPSGLFLYSDAVLPEHSRTVLNPLYAIREDHFHCYLGYFQTIEMLENGGFAPILIRPYTYRYQTFDKYLEGVDADFESQNGNLRSFAHILKGKIRRAWQMLDDTVKREMMIRCDKESMSFGYYMIDVAAKREKMQRSAG